MASENSQTRMSLLEAMVSNDRKQTKAAWMEFVGHYAPRIHYRCCRMVSQVDADDLTQEILSRVFKGLKQFLTRYTPGAGHFHKWLNLVIKNRCFSFLGRPRIEMQPGTDEEPFDPSGRESSPLEEVIAKEIDQMLKTATERVFERHPRAKEICFLMNEEGKSIREVATILGMSEANIYQLRSRMKADLSQEIEKLMKADSAEAESAESPGTET